MRRLAVLFLPLLIASCSTSGDDAPVYQPRQRPMTARASDAAFDMLPPADWWHQPMIANAVRLTPDQISALDKISQDQGSDVSKIETDMTIAVRDLRTQIDNPQATAPDIVAAGERIRSLRDSMFDRQLKMLAAERTVLTLDQWHTLQEQMQEQRREQRNEGGYRRRGGRGMGGRGRWPGM